MRSRLALPLILLVIAGCQVDSTRVAPRPRALQRTELFFGLARANQPNVSDDDWRKFVDEIVTPRFPEGLTVLDARGQWRGENGQIVSEPSRVLILMHSNSREDNREIEEIRREYKLRFDQEAVMRADSPLRVSF